MMIVFFLGGLGPSYETISDAILGSDKMTKAAVLAKLQKSWFSRKESSRQEGNTSEHVSRESDIVCFKCGEKGHKKSECPKLRGKKGAGKKPPKNQKKKVRFGKRNKRSSDKTRAADDDTDDESEAFAGQVREVDSCKRKRRGEPTTRDQISGQFED